MTITPKKSKKQLAIKKYSLWFERGMALFAAFNFGLVLFDFTYIPLRSFWLQRRVQFSLNAGPYRLNIPQTPWQIPLIPPIANYYDWVKGIEPFRDTDNYLKKVDQLQKEVESTTQVNLKDSVQIKAILEDLQTESISMIETNPFQLANQTGSLERIKNRMREHIFNDEDSSSKQAFKTFWSPDHLFRQGALSYVNDLNFFNKQIRPLIETNYFRSFSETGQFTDNFYLIDFPYTVIFLVEFLARTWLISRRHKGLKWREAMLWRWYDIFLFISMFIPFIPWIRLLRIIPVTLRLNQAKLINLKTIQRQASQGFVASIAQDVTEVVILQVVNQIQELVEEGQIRRVLAEGAANDYIDLNDTDEIAEITKLVIETLTTEILPKVRPDIEAIIVYSLNQGIRQTPLYEGARNLPNWDNFQTQLTQSAVTQGYQVVWDAILNLLKEDPEFDKLLQQLIETVKTEVNTEIQAQQSMSKMESLITDLLEEVKVNYVQRLSQEDMDALLEQKRILHESGKGKL